MTQVIDSFRGKHSFLSNFYPSPIEYRAKTWPTLEHAYQAAKTHNRDQQEKIRLAETPGQAKRLGRQVDLRPDWDEVKVGVMRDLVNNKFFQHPCLWEKLIETGNAILIEGNTWHDDFWGDCQCSRCQQREGRNMLGKILMEQREAQRRHERRRFEDIEPPSERSSKVTEQKHIEIYTDGACSGNPGPGGWGALLQWNGHERVVRGHVPHTTNNRMELQAVVAGLTALKEPCQVTVGTDSQYVIGVASRGWKRKAHLDLLSELDTLCEMHDVEFEKVRGHAGHPLNERADRIAKQEREKARALAAQMGDENSV